MPAVPASGACRVNPTVLFTPAGARYVVQFAYSPVVVEIMKAVVPPAARSWSQEARKWTVDVDWVGPLGAALRAAGCIVIGLGEQAHCASAAWALSLFHAVGPHRTPAVHRALSKVLHPDNAETGCPVLQRELNAARAAVEVKS